MGAIVRAAVLVLLVSAFAPVATAAADTLAESSTYFALLPDPRLCPSPQCGGVFARRINLAVTRCPDGLSGPVCHAGDVDWSALGVDGEELARIQAAVLRGDGIVRGRLLRGREVPGGFAGRLVVTEAWIAATSALADGDVYRVRDLGIVCVTTPCFFLHASTLNTTRHRDISGLDLTGVSGGEEAQKALRTTSLLVSGRFHAVREGGREPGVELVATQVYLLVAPR